MVEGQRRIPVRIGVNRGALFAGDVGPGHRRTYTTMGDGTNLAARLMAKAPSGAMLATAAVLDRSATSFELEELPPFTVKGKKRPVTAWSVGPARRSPSAQPSHAGLRLVGRAAELAAIDGWLAGARAGAGRLVEIAGEGGVGKSRLALEARRAAGGMRILGGMCDAYGSGTPYALWRDVLRQSLGLGWEDPDEVVLDRLRAEIAAGDDPDLMAWTALLGDVFDVRAPASPAHEPAAEFLRGPHPRGRPALPGCRASRADAGRDRTGPPDRRGVGGAARRPVRRARRVVLAGAGDHAGDRVGLRGRRPSVRGAAGPGRALGR